jgi:hypothetical protein
MVMDYKTGDQGGDPKAARDRSGNWRDLQLPLYRHLLLGGLERPDGSALERPDPQDTIQLAYLPLSREAEDVALRVAPWSLNDLEEAEERAREVIRWLRTTDELPFEPQRAGRKASEAVMALLGQGFLQSTEGEG